MKIVILGAGVIGVTSAWYLRQAGHDVQVVDRRASAGLETSFANGGQISADNAAPWAKPGVPLQALKWLMREDAPLLFRLRADPAQWRWTLQFLAQCSAGNYRRNCEKLVRLGKYSREALGALTAETGLAYDHVARGILMLYTDGRAVSGGMKTRDECVAIEPAVASLGARLAGGMHLTGDQSGDAYKFTRGLAQKCAEKGVKFDFDETVEGFDFDSSRIHGLKTNRRKIKADAFVLSLGSYSPLLAKPIGIDLPVYPLKGYSVTLPIKNEAAAWTASLSDEAHKLVLSRLGDRLRIAGTAELNGWDPSVNEVRCRAIVKRVMDLFPEAGDASKATFWSGLRPATPSNIPHIGKTKYPNLFLNTGHGSLGWTFACGSARILTDIVAGRKPEMELH